MMTRLINNIVFLFFLVSPLFLLAGKKDSISVLFYNVENLFDVADDTTKNDNEFLPTSKKHWNYNKMQDKIHKIAQVILAAELPDVIGLCEVENEWVVNQLKYHQFLKNKHYEVLHIESPDQRGIDCALLYDSKKFDLLAFKAEAVKLKGQRNTRDILIATLASKKDTFTFFVNHWPSRYGGKKKSIPKRIIAANTLKHVLDSVNKIGLKIIAMGDFNDEPKDSSLQLLKKYKNPSGALNGTIKYRGKWQMFDQFIYSPNIAAKMTILTYPFLLEDDNTYGGSKPFRTYYGPRYNGGFSDHLPILLKFSSRR